MKGVLPCCALLLGCDVRSTVGFNESAQPSLAGVSCAADSPLAKCGSGPCVVTNVFDAPAGSISVAVDTETVYFIQSQTVLAKRSLAGGPSTDLAGLSQLMKMAVDEDHLYWTELNGEVRAVPKQGGESYEAANVFGNPLDLTLDDTHLYWTLPEFGLVAMAEKPMGEATQIAGQISPLAIAVDATHVYWVNYGNDGAMDGELVRAPRGDLAGLVVVRSGLDSPLAVALSDDSVYWASKSTLYGMPKTGGEPAQLATGFEEIKDIRVWEDTVYGVGMEGLWRVPASGGAPAMLDNRSMSAITLACSGVYASAWFVDGFVRYAP
jgi:hypothetical protein